RIGHAQRDEPAVHQGIDRVVEIAHGKGHVATEPERVEPVDPHIIASLRAAGLANRAELGPGQLVERPALGAMLSSSIRPVKRTLALAPVKTAEMTARQRYPEHAVCIDLAAARPEAGR